MSATARILVVDDLPRNIRLLEAVLAPRGHEVVGAGSGAEGLALAAQGDIDLVLLDIVMPEMDGYEVCRRLRDDEATRFLPIVMITASGEQGIRYTLHKNCSFSETQRSMFGAKEQQEGIGNHGNQRDHPPRLSEPYGSRAKSSIDKSSDRVR